MLFATPGHENHHTDQTCRLSPLFSPRSSSMEPLSALEPPCYIFPHMSKSGSRKYVNNRKSCRATPLTRLLGLVLQQSPLDHSCDPTQNLHRSHAPKNRRVQPKLKSHILRHGRIHWRMDDRIFLRARATMQSIPPVAHIPRRCLQRRGTHSSPPHSHPKPTALTPPPPVRPLASHQRNRHPNRTPPPRLRHLPPLGRPNLPLAQSHNPHRLRLPTPRHHRHRLPPRDLFPARPHHKPLPTRKRIHSLDANRTKLLDYFCHDPGFVAIHA